MKFLNQMKDIQLTLRNWYVHLQPKNLLLAVDLGYSVVVMRARCCYFIRCCTRGSGSIV